MVLWRAQAGVVSGRRNGDSACPCLRIALVPNLLSRLQVCIVRIGGVELAIRVVLINIFSSELAWILEECARRRPFHAMPSVAVRSAGTTAGSLAVLHLLEG